MVELTNLKTQLADTAAKNRTINTDKLCEVLRKTAFEQALLGHSALRYQYDLPIDGAKLKEYFTSQDVQVEIDYYNHIIKLSW